MSTSTFNYGGINAADIHDDAESSFEYEGSCVDHQTTLSVDENNVTSSLGDPDCRTFDPVNFSSSYPKDGQDGMGIFEVLCQVQFDHPDSDKKDRFKLFIKSKGKIYQAVLIE